MHFFYIIANIKCIYIISSYLSKVFLNTFYRIDINKENELTKMMLQLCRIGALGMGAFFFLLCSIDIPRDGIGALERS